MANLRITDWSGGITDHYINGGLNQSQTIDNLLIDRNGKLISRYGCETTLFNNAVSDIGRVSDIFSMKLTDGTRRMYKHFAGRVRDDFSAGEITGTSGKFFAGDSGGIAPSGVLHASYDVWNNQILAVISSEDQSTNRYMPVIHFREDDGSSRVMQSGPNIPNVVIPAQPSGSSSYLVAAVAEFSYRIGQTDYIMRSQPWFPTTPLIRSTISAGAPLNLQYFFDAVGTPNRWATDNVPHYWNSFTGRGLKYKFYRSVASGTVLYYCGEVIYDVSKEGAANLGTVVLGLTDSQISVNATLYTTGGVLDDTQAPHCKYLTVVGGSCWYANIEEGVYTNRQNKPFRVVQSKRGSPTAVPGSAYVDVDGEITAINRISNFPIVFTGNRTYRLEGSYTTTGGGSVRAVEISSTIGCVSNSSVVRYKSGLFFAGNDGFYFTDGFQVKKISQHLDKSYSAWTSTREKQLRIVGAIDDITERIYWTVSNGTVNADVNETDGIVVCDPYFGIKENMTFTTISGGADTTWTATALAFANGSWYRGNIDSKVWKHSSSLTYDSYWDLFVKKIGIVWDWVSTATPFGDNVNKKWVTSFNAIFRNDTNLSCVPYSANDASGDFRKMKEIRMQPGISWGDVNFVWGDGDLIWNYTGNMVVSRKFPAGTIRCTHKQLRLHKEPTIIARSDDYTVCSCVLIAGNYFAVLPSGYTWPRYLANFFIHFEHDNYAYGHRIINPPNDNVDGDTLGIDNSLFNLLIEPNQKWIIRGVPLDEVMALESVDISFQMFGESTPGWQPADTGDNDNA